MRRKQKPTRDQRTFSIPRRAASAPPATSWWAEPKDWAAWTDRARSEWLSRMRYSVTERPFREDR